MKWPSRVEVDRAARDWARRLASAHPDVRAVGYFGSYARDQWAVGSDLDLVVILEQDAPDTRPDGNEWITEHLPVPVDLLVYSVEQWKQLKIRQPRFYHMLKDQTVWIWGEAPQV